MTCYEVLTHTRTSHLMTPVVTDVFIFVWKHAQELVSYACFNCLVSRAPFELPNRLLVFIHVDFSGESRPKRWLLLISEGTWGRGDIEGVKGGGEYI